MSQVSPIEQAVIARLQEDSDPYLRSNLWSERTIDSVREADGAVRVTVHLPIPARLYQDELRRRLQTKLLAVPGVQTLSVEIDWRVDSAAPRNVPSIPGVKNIVAVASGKGGVGKSTTAANLALALAREGAAVGMLDADIYGPSQPRMLGLSNERPTSADGRSLTPPIAHGIKLMSVGLLIDEEQPMVWRGPMVTQALNQFLTDTQWGELDYLVVDMPPGTGDIALTLSQRVPVSGAVIVTTPQDIALLDARKALKMFQKVGVPVLGIVENMSVHVCTKCGHQEPIFGAGGGARMAEQYGVDLLARLPLDIRIREQADGGRPTVVAEPDCDLSRAYLELARHTAARLAGARAAFPNISVEAS